MKSRLLLPLFVLCAMALLLRAPAQTPATAPAAPPPPQTPVLKVTTRLVQVNVVVHGKKNEPVADLTKDDFTILEDNHPQKIATFAMESSRPADARPTRYVLPQNTFTNKAEYRPAVAKAVTVILLDSLNTGFEDQAYSKKQLISFLQQLHPEDSVALYALSTQLQVLHDFTSDAASLIAAAGKHKNRAATELADSHPEDPDTGNDDLDAFLAQGQQKIADAQMMNRVETTMKALEAIANHVSSLPGRKNLIWISGGFPFQIGMDEMTLGDTRERRTFTEDMEHAARAVTAAQLAIYPVDARGLIGSPDFTSTVSGSKNARMPPQAGTSKKMQLVYDSHDTMNIMAERTGGKAYYNSNDLKNAIRGAIDDAQVTYVLGYYPSHNNWDGKFHNLKVHVNRKGVNVRNRLGYFAFADVPQGQQDRRKALREAAWSVLDATQLGLVVRAARDLPQPGRLRVVLSLDIHNVNLEQKGDRWTGGIDLLFVQQSALGQAPTVVNDSLTLNLTKESYTAALKTGLRFGKDLDLANAGYYLRVAARDVATGNVGSVNIRTDKLKPEPPPAAKPAQSRRNKSGVATARRQRHRLSPHAAPV